LEKKSPRKATSLAYPSLGRMDQISQNVSPGRQHPYKSIIKTDPFLLFWGEATPYQKNCKIQLWQDSSTLWFVFMPSWWRLVMGKWAKWCMV